MQIGTVYISRESNVALQGRFRDRFTSVLESVTQRVGSWQSQVIELPSSMQTNPEPEDRVPAALCLRLFSYFLAPDQGGSAEGLTLPSRQK
jgi:hypothetical protein